MDLSGPFRGSAAVRAGALTWRVLAGPRFRRLFPDTYVPAELELTPAVRALAAGTWAGERGVVAAWSAAELWDASCGPAEAAAEVIVPGGGYRRPLDGLTVYRDRPAPNEVVEVAGVRLTTPVRTAFDIARHRGVTDGVVAIDALARAQAFSPAALMILRTRHLGARGVGSVWPAVRLADPRSESPMESRIRLILVDHGLPAPAVQHPVPFGTRCHLLDLAYPRALLAVEYDGRHHLTPDRARRDLEREARLAAAGWKVLRFDAHTVLRRPRALAAEVAYELRVRGGA